MNMDILILRHGKTRGNIERRYCGRTDEPLDAEHERELKDLRGSFLPERVFVSPLKRTKRTADLCFSGVPVEEVYDIREMDFGVFEGKNADELEHDSQYSAWLDTYCTAPCPGGEGLDDFNKRTCSAFEDIVKRSEAEGREMIAIVAHGGTAMALMSAYADETREFYKWMPKNGSGFIVRLNRKEDGRPVFTDIKEV